VNLIHFTNPNPNPNPRNDIGKMVIKTTTFELAIGAMFKNKAKCYHTS